MGTEGTLSIARVSGLCTSQSLNISICLQRGQVGAEGIFFAAEALGVTLVKCPSITLQLTAAACAKAAKLH